MEIEFNHVYYTYDPNSSIKVVALRDVNLKLEYGKVNGIIGSSGSGKTTMMELINGLLSPTKGKINVLDYQISKKKIKNINGLRKKVGLVFQFPEEQFFNLSVKSELEFGMKNFNYRIKDIDKRVVDALIMVGLDESYLDRDPFKLSSGEQRKVAIASILVFNPEVLILDEPTVGLDYKSKCSLIDLIRRLKNRYHKTVVIVTHDVDMLHQIVDNVVVLNKGEVVLEGDKYKVFSNYAAMKAYGIKMPKVMEFSYKALTVKKVKMGYRDDINDLIKDVYRYVK